MALTTSKEVWKILIGIFLALTIGFGLLFYFRFIFGAFLLGVVLILITEKLGEKYGKSVRAFNLSRWQKKILGYILLLAFLFFFFQFFGNSLLDLQKAITGFQESESVTYEYLEKVEKYLPAILGSREAYGEFIKNAEIYIITTFKGFFGRFTKLLSNSVLIVPLLFYMYFRRREAIGKAILKATPKKLHAGASRAFHDITSQLKGYSAAKGTETLAVGIICCIGFYLAGLQGWLILGFLCGILNIIPYIGPIIGAFPAVLIALLISPQTAIIVLITVVIAQLVDNLYLVPFMISSKVKIDPLLTIVLILIGAQLQGPIGMILAVPIFLVYKTVLKESYEELVQIYRG